MEELLSKIRACNLCNDLLPLGPRPIVAASPKSRIAIIGQAPGSVVHESGVPWDDKSGENLRAWMQISSEDFYNPDKLALIPMGFCYPGRGKSGDNPPTAICAPTWHDQLLNELQELRLILLVGKYAQDHYLGAKAQRTLTQTVQQFEDYLPKFFALPHPSPRNNIWQAKNPWFKSAVLPRLAQEVAFALRH
ncbi:uracil-DNA glycosylase family protein [Gilvibacter sediminis]|uniref:uracil-DNA glycosylase family protein n=1 Tax=Gilvibacter sediminis TaxID=379071 RepID=UPI00235085E6|nr:uracil-DNA glycosylase family protein [Gilvibacter sediminis]MDC7997456.1 uracil-DNA glycosylase family protein [Gilvibacter sediminis]